ncbi:hypothetical protein RJT34_01923 [Clitoria ternatea]|uniref:Uncharacterized protein n=1 Tax=Clitoria ternatea TaxID=43366 RepID=A0AAN9Q033_CLITE
MFNVFTLIPSVPTCTLNSGLEGDPMAGGSYADEGRTHTEKSVSTLSISTLTRRGILGSRTLACSRTKRVCVHMARLCLMIRYVPLVGRSCAHFKGASMRNKFIAQLGIKISLAYVQGLRAYACVKVMWRKEIVGERGYAHIQACLRAYQDDTIEDADNEAQVQEGYYGSSEKVPISTKNSCVGANSNGHNTGADLRKKCQLFIDRVDDPVALGMVYSRSLVHGQPSLDDISRVSVVQVITPDMVVLVPIEEVFYVSQALQ